MKLSLELNLNHLIITFGRFTDYLIKVQILMGDFRPIKDWSLTKAKSQQVFSKGGLIYFAHHSNIFIN